MREEAWLAQEDFYFFVRFCFLKNHGARWLRAEHHKKICRALMDVFQGKTKRLIVNIPPRYSKTELAVVNFIAWCFGKNPACKFIHTSYGAELAEQNAYNVRALMMSDSYRAVFPWTVLEADRVSHIRTTAGGELKTAGTGGALTGFGAGGMEAGTFSGAIIVDDPHKPDEALSDTIRKKAKNWYSSTLEHRVNSRETPIILIMQRLHEDDLAGWLARGGDGNSWTVLSIPALDDEGRALWPEKHTSQELWKMERANPYVFAGQYMQSPAPLEGGLFKPGRIEPMRAVPVGNFKTVRGWDLGASVDGDYTVGVKICRMEDGRFVVLDMVRGQLETNERDELIRNTAAADGMGCVQSIPQDPGQAGKSLAAYLAGQLAGLPVVFSPETGDKITRAAPFSSQVNAGNVCMVSAAWNFEMLDELRLFPNARHDDIVDAASRAFSELVQSKPAFSIADF